MHVIVKVITAIVFEPVSLHALPNRELSSFLSESGRHFIPVGWWRSLFLRDGVDLFIDVELLDHVSAYSERLAMCAAELKGKSPIRRIVTGGRRELSVLLTRIIVLKALLCRTELDLKPQVGIVEVTVHIDCTPGHLFGVTLDFGEALRFGEEMGLLRW